MGTHESRVLIVDDDLPLLRVLTAYVSRLGYHVVPCDDAERARKLVEAEPSAYDVALVDMNMPGLRGEELARRILERNASIRVIMASGYPFEWSAAGPLPGHDVGFLHKPFTPQELAHAIAARPAGN